MNLQTRTLMSVSAMYMAVLGLGASFLPQETLSYSGSPAAGLAVVLLQITGALYLGFSFLNWTARGVLIGGIYSRPLVLGNFMHFAVVTIVLVKSLLDQTMPVILVGAVIYSVLAAWFGLVLFTHPANDGKPER